MRVYIIKLKLYFVIFVRFAFLTNIKLTMLVKVTSSNDEFVVKIFLKVVLHLLLFVPIFIHKLSRCVFLKLKISLEINRSK